jgi:alkylation response protein AidB-like acyl-CoA dehydrogenase
VKTRQQFGKPIAAFQTVQHRIAEMAVHCEEAVSILELASLQTSDAPLRRFASAAKVKVGAGAKFVSETAVQLHGGIGITEELSVGGYLRLLLNYQLSFGAADRHLARYAAATIPSRASALSSVLG